MPDEPLSTRSSSPFPYSSITGLLFGIIGVLSGESILEPSVGEPPDYSEAEMKQIEELLRMDPADLTEEEAKRLEDLIGFIPSEPLPAEPSPPPWSDTEMKEIDELMRKDPADLTESESMRLKELLGYDPEDLQDPGTIADFDTEDPFAALAGATVSVAVTRLAAGASVHLLADMASADAAKTLADLAEDSADDVTVTVDNTTVTVVSRDYAPSDGKLADDSAFQEAMACAPAEAEVAVYINLGAALTGEQRQKLPVRAIGYAQGMEGSEHTGCVRVMVE